MQASVLAALCPFVILAMVSRRASFDAFLGGAHRAVHAPALWIMGFSEVTTRIFAHSLKNCAIPGCYHGLWPVLAHAGYRGSFLTGGLMIRRVPRPVALRSRIVSFAVLLAGARCAA